LSMFMRGIRRRGLTERGGSEASDIYG